MSTVNNYSEVRFNRPMWSSIMRAFIERSKGMGVSSDVQVSANVHALSTQVAARGMTFIDVPLSTPPTVEELRGSPFQD